MTVVVVLALATLGGATEIGSSLFFVKPPKVAKASTIVTVTGIGIYAHVSLLLAFLP